MNPRSSRSTMTFGKDQLGVEKKKKKEIHRGGKKSGFH